MTELSLSGMSPYDRAAWEDIQKWKAKKPAPSLAPAGAGKALARAGRAAATRAAEVPFASTAASSVQRAAEGMFESADRLAVASVRRTAIRKRFARAGHPIDELSDARSLDLKTLDEVRPRVDLRYMLASAAEGAGAGAAMTGAGALAAGGTVFGLGAGAAPGAGLLLATTLADAVAVVGACSRVAAEIGAYYGYDAELPQERLYSMGVLGVAMASSEGAKAAAYQELNKVVQALARQQTWKQLDSLVMTKVIKRVLGRYAEQVTRRKLGQAVPVLGIALGAGLNAKTLMAVATGANYVYRERFLADKYGLTPADARSGGGDDALDIMAMVEDEIAADADIVNAEVIDEAKSTPE